MLFGRIFITLALQHLQSVDQTRACFPWFDHVIDIPAVGSDIRVRKLMTVVLHKLTAVCVHVIGLSYSGHPDLVRQFVELARTEGPAIFAKHGYVK